MPSPAKSSRRSLSGFTFQSVLRDMRRERAAVPRTRPDTAIPEAGQEAAGGLPGAAIPMLAVLRRLDRAFEEAARAGRRAPDADELHAIRRAARAAIDLAGAAATP